MKKICTLMVFAVLCLGVFSQVKFTALEFSPAYPKPGDKITFTYNASYSPLKSEKNVAVVAYAFDDKSWVALEPLVKKTANMYTGTIQTNQNDNAIAFTFTAGENKDQNAGKGYVIPLYSAGNQMTEGAYKTMSNLNMGMGEYLLGTKNDAEAGLRYLEDLKNMNPALENDPKFMGQYLNTLSSVKKKEATPMIEAALTKFSAQPNLKEDDYGFLGQWYSRLKQKAVSDSLMELVKTKYPNGNMAKQKLLQPFFTEKDPAKKVELYNAFVAKYPMTKENEDQYKFYMNQITNAYANAKDYRNYTLWNEKGGKTSAAFNNNNISWKMAEAGENIPEALKMAESATMYAQQQMKTPTELKPATLTNAQWKEQREKNFAMYADTYAYILYQMGDYKKAYPYTMEAATINKLADAEYNERYALVAAKTQPLPQAKTLIEGFVRDGVATAKTKDALKELYVKEKKSDKGYDEYLAKLEAAAMIKKKAELAKTMINEAAPNFALKDWEGKSVNLADYKGKTVIVDFWATWCGPCIASMPGMNKAVAKYKDNDNVKFLFVDTWETEKDKNKNSQDFMTKKGYPFYVLMDNEDKMVADYGVSGIPTKFIIDKNGKIRFKAVGFSGSTDGLADEIDMMVDMVK